jgi:hypothetical protein
MEAVPLDNPVLTALRGLLSEGVFTAKGVGLPCLLQEGHPESRVVLIVGDNPPHQGDVVQVLSSKLDAAFFSVAAGRSRPNWLMLDEPESELAESYCQALGIYLANVGNRLPLEDAPCLVVMSSSRKLMCAMTFSLAQTPHVLCLGSYESEDAFQAWLEDERERTVEELLALVDAPGGRRQGVAKLVERIEFR